MTAAHGGRTGPRIGSLCTGYGGLDLATMWVLGGRPAWCAENDRHAAAIVATRFPGTPNLGDVTAIDWRAVPAIDVLTAGFPCQDISDAGHRAGIAKGTRSGIWADITTAVRLLRPKLLLVENVAALRWRGLGRVLGDLAETGYDTTWASVRAGDVGAPHRRERMFILAAPATAAADTERPRPLRRHATGTQTAGRAPGQPQRCGLPRPADGMPYRCRAASVVAHPDRLQPERRRERRLMDGEAESPQGRRNDRWNRHAAVCRRPDGHRTHELPGGERDRAWGPYTEAIRRWERILGRAAPAPTEIGRHGTPRLAATFVEWMMGLPPGWVTGIDGLPRGAQLRALGNGVVPAQAAHALRILLREMPYASHAAGRTR